MEELIPVIVLGAVSSMGAFLIASYNMIMNLKENLYEKKAKKLEWENHKLELANDMYLRKEIMYKKLLAEKENKENEQH